MTRVLVTGATGFIGRRLVERLVERGDEVTCLVRPTSKTEGLQVATIVGSLDDQASLSTALRGFEVVYHLAGLTHAPRLSEFMEVNSAGTERLCRAATESTTPPTVVLVSSLAATGPSAAGEAHTESTPAKPISNYGRSKLAGEHAARGFANNLPVSIVRPPVVFGPRDRDGLLLFQSLRRFPLHVVPQMKGLPLSLVYVDDLVDAFIRVAEHGQRATPEPTDPTGLYFAADPQVASYAEMGRMAAAAMDRKAWVLCRRKYPFLPLAIAGDLYGRIRGKAPLFGMDKLREASASGWVSDPNKIITELDWQPAKLLAQRYAETFQWYTSNGWL